MQATREDEQKLFDDLLSCIGNRAYSLPSTRLTAFCAMKGDKADGKLMIIGRAVNGWWESWNPSDTSDPARRAEILQQTYRHSGGIGDCPMLWVSQRWGASDGYSTKKSAFWRTSKLITEALGIADETQDNWPSHLIWSNLYKVAPGDGGNPSSELRSVQLSPCIELLRQELVQWRPARALFFTGIRWVMPFLPSLNFDCVSKTENALVELTGKISFPEVAHKLVVVVAKHPQGKPERTVAEEVVRFFQQVEVKTP
ncbi:hypothetical protein HYR69_03420 [Candidatus Sumerlaeota bacterium]|nr:hypothetical protein [Candidatus Sumerlaeota bacterium]